MCGKHRHDRVRRRCRAGVIGAEVGTKVLEPQRVLALPATGASALSFLSVDTRTPYMVDCTGEDGGKTVHYMLRGVATTGEEGPWSEMPSATIGGVDD